MFQHIQQWYRNKFSDPNAVTLFLLLIVSVLLIVFFGGILAPILAAIALAYLLDWPVNRLIDAGMGRLAATIIVEPHHLYCDAVPVYARASGLATKHNADS